MESRFQLVGTSAIDAFLDRLEVEKSEALEVASPLALSLGSSTGWGGEDDDTGQYIRLLDNLRHNIQETSEIWDSNSEGNDQSFLRFTPSDECG